MNRYDQHFRSLPAHVRANAGYKVEFAEDALIRHRMHGASPHDDDAVAQQFDLAGMIEFWEVELSESMSCDALARSLSLHFYAVQLVADEDREKQTEDNRERQRKASKAVDDISAGILQALRVARAAGETWFRDAPQPSPGKKLDHAKALMQLPEPQRVGRRRKFEAESYSELEKQLGFIPSDTVFVTDNPRSDGIYLSTLLVDPKAAVEWMLASPKRRHLVPPSLARFLNRTSAKEVSCHGRPKGTGYDSADQIIVDQMLRLVTSGQQPSLTAAAQQIVGRDGKGAPGSGSAESKISRLVRRAGKRLSGE